MSPRPSDEEIARRQQEKADKKAAEKVAREQAQLAQDLAELKAEAGRLQIPESDLHTQLARGPGEPPPAQRQSVEGQCGRCHGYCGHFHPH